MDSSTRMPATYDQRGGTMRDPIVKKPPVADDSY